MVPTTITRPRRKPTRTSTKVRWAVGGILLTAGLVACFLFTWESTFYTCSTVTGKDPGRTCQPIDPALLVLLFLPGLAFFVPDFSEFSIFGISAKRIAEEAKEQASDATVTAVEAVETVKREAAASTEEPELDPPPLRGMAASVAGAAPSSLGPIDTIVWVDDHPEQNRPFIVELERRFRVRTPTTDDATLDLVDQRPGHTLVITDSARHIDGQLDVTAGTRLLRRIHETYPLIPLLVFAGARTVEQHGGEFRDAGARGATAAFGELSKMVDSLSRERFREVVGAVVEAAGGSEIRYRESWWSLPDGTWLEARDWRRTPTAEAVNRVWERAAHRLEEDGVGTYLIVTPKDVLIPQQLGRAPDGLEVVSYDDLVPWMRDHGFSTDPPPDAEPPRAT